MKIAGIRFKKAGRIHPYLDNGLELNPGERVVVVTGKGLELGRVVNVTQQDEAKDEIPPVLRRATAEDLQAREKHVKEEKEALSRAVEVALRLNLPMKMLAAEYNLEGSRLTFYFSAESRIDFHEISRELAALLKTKVELRQIGPRDAAKMMEGCGPCGRNLCCSVHLCEFEPVSIKMAKEQEIPLTPMKISGLCGRLLCCLSYEAPHYHAMAEKMPRRGQEVMTPQGKARVTERNLLKETVTVETENQTIVELKVDQIKMLPRAQKNPEPARNRENNQEAPRKED